MNFILSYDISNDRKRTRLAQLLLEQGCVRLQKSVFWGSDFSPKRLNTLRQKVQKRLEKDPDPNDSVLYVPIEQDYIGQMVWCGAADLVAKWQNPPAFRIF
jgi:CRISPR-associated endonuclease Cas2